jgi:hypothetical protein
MSDMAQELIDEHMGQMFAAFNTDMEAMIAEMKADPRQCGIRVDHAHEFHMEQTLFGWRFIPDWTMTLDPAVAYGKAVINRGDDHVPPAP